MVLRLHLEGNCIAIVHEDRNMQNLQMYTAPAFVFVSPCSHGLNFPKSSRHALTSRFNGRPASKRIASQRRPQPAKTRNDTTIARQSADAVPLSPGPSHDSVHAHGNRYVAPYPPEFVAMRRRIFIGMSSMYALYVALRATWTFVSPTAATALNLSLNHVGFIASAFPVMYGASRLITSVLADRTSPSKALGVGLGLAGLANIIMSFISRPGMLAGMWGLNGLVQGVGAGASARLLTSWHSRKERGFWWAVWSSSANLGGFFAPLVCGWLSTTAIGFRAGLLVPGIFSLVFAIAVSPFLRDSPTAAGLKIPWLRDEERQRSSVVSSTPPLKSASSNDGTSNTSSLPENATFWETLVHGVLKNKRIWALAAAYFFVYLVRQGLRSWLHFYLAQARSCDAASAAYRVSGMEVGGILGTFSSGYISDKLDGRRVAVTIVYLLGLVTSLFAAAAAPAGCGPLMDIAIIFLIGLFINGPQCLIGLIGAEVCDPRVVATATGILGWISYGGAASSGLPLSMLVRHFGWNAFFATMIAASLSAAVILLPMIRLGGHSLSNSK